jgi:hypothetical protein
MGHRSCGIRCSPGRRRDSRKGASLHLGGEIKVILPTADYRERKVKPDNRATFEALIERAVRVVVLPFETSNRAADMAASEALLGEVEHLVAVWDGEPSDGHGGTGDVVAAARALGLPVTVVWPDGACRRDDA